MATPLFFEAKEPRLLSSWEQQAASRVMLQITQTYKKFFKTSDPFVHLGGVYKYSYFIGQKEHQLFILGTTNETQKEQYVHVQRTTSPKGDSHYFVIAQNASRKKKRTVEDQLYYAIQTHFENIISTHIHQQKFFERITMLRESRASTSLFWKKISRIEWAANQLGQEYMDFIITVEGISDTSISIPISILPSGDMLNTFKRTLKVVRSEIDIRRSVFPFVYDKKDWILSDDDFARIFAKLMTSALNDGYGYEYTVSPQGAVIVNWKKKLAVTTVYVSESAS